MRRRGVVVVLGLCLVACGGGSTPPRARVAGDPGPTCSDVATHIIAMLPTRPQRESEYAARAAARIRIRCTQDAWAVETRRCFAGAASFQDAQRCTKVTRPPPLPAPVVALSPPAAGPARPPVQHSPVDDETALSAKKFVYAAFFNRLKRQVAQNWDPATVWRRRDPTGTMFGFKTRITEVRVSLSRNGELARLVVSSPSGIGELDVEAVRAFMSAGPFPAPPEGLIEDDYVTFAFSFVFELGAPRITWRLPRALPDAPQGPPPPRPPEAPPNVAPMALDAHRITGEKNIVPDDETKNAIQLSGKEKLIGSYKFCITAEGVVSAVNQLKSTGFPAYDNKIVSTIRHEWRYRPFIVNGEATPVCTAVTFIYRQVPLEPPSWLVPPTPPPSISPSLPRS